MQWIYSLSRFSKCCKSEKFFLMKDLFNTYTVVSEVWIENLVMISIHIWLQSWSECLSPWEYACVRLSILCVLVPEQLNNISTAKLNFKGQKKLPFTESDSRSEISRMLIQEKSLSCLAILWPMTPPPHDKTLRSAGWNLKISS